MDTTNIFVAALPSQEVQTQIMDTIRTHKSSLEYAHGIRWERPVDLHITLGYLRGIKTSDISQVLPHFEAITHHSCIQTAVKGATVYGSALCLQLAPLEAYLKLHQCLEAALEQSCQGIYEFNSHNHCDFALSLLGFIYFGEISEP